MLRNEGVGLKRVEIFQNGDQPLYGLKFTFLNGETQMVGNTGGQEPLNCELDPSERIVGIGYKANKPMYRYGMRFMVLSDQ